MTVSNMLGTLDTSTSAVIVPPVGKPPESAGNREGGAVRTLQVDAARPALAAPKGGDQSATTGRGPAAIVKISKAAAEASTRANTPGPSLPNELSDAERQVVTKLKATDREVRAHERAHATAGGQHAGAPSYDYQRGPDGRQYAVGGEVPIDTSPVPGDPEATIDKMEIVKRAALAPADPSGQDRSVAAQADAKKLKAQAELAQQKADERAASAEAQAPDDATQGGGTGGNGVAIAIATVAGGGLIGPAVNGTGLKASEPGTTLRLVA